MPIITIGSSKGGCGKSTTATNLVAAYAQKNTDILFVDGDQQKSSTSWSLLREQKQVEPFITVIEKTGEGFAQSVRATAQKYGCTFIDVPGHQSIELRSSLMISDILVMPVRPSNFDSWTFAGDLEIIQQARLFNPDLKVLVFMNGLNTLPSVRNREIQDLTEFFSNYEGFDVAEAKFCHRGQYNQAVALGKGVVELEGVGDSIENAKEEVRALYNEIFARIQ